MSRLVLIRHGRTAWNHEGRAQGHIDVSLDETGCEQAMLLAPYVAAMRPLALWSSDLARARETAEALSAATGLAVRPDPRLREYDVGERAGLTEAEFADRLPEVYAAWRSGDLIGNAAGAETPADVLARMLPALREIHAATPADGTSVVVSHGASLRTCLVALLGWPEEQDRHLRPLDNCGWAVLEDSPHAPGLRLASYNETVHTGTHDPDFTSDSPVG